MRTWIWLLGMLWWTGPALAEPRWLEFERLESARIADQVEVRYRLAPASWQLVVQSGEDLQLIAEVLAAGRRSHVGRGLLKQPEGQFRFTFPEDLEPRSVRFALQHPAVDGFLQAGVGVVTVSRALDGSGGAVGRSQSVSRVRPRRAFEACADYGGDAEDCQQLIEGTEVGAALVIACGDQGRNRLECLRNSVNQNTDMASAVRACASLVNGIDERQRCVAASAGAQHDPAALVRACGRSFETTAARLNCVALGASTRAPATGLVEQCAFAFEGPIARLDCIALGQSSPVDLAPGVAACRQAMPWATPRRRCVEAAASAKVDISSAIIACRSGARSPAAVLQCVQTAARGNDAAMATTIHGCSRATDDVGFNQCVAQAVGIQ